MQASLLFASPIFSPFSFAAAWLTGGTIINGCISSYIWDELHWLTLWRCIEHKVFMVMYNSLRGCVLGAVCCLGVCQCLAHLASDLSASLAWSGCSPSSAFTVQPIHFTIVILLHFGTGCHATCSSGSAISGSVLIISWKPFFWVWFCVHRLGTPLSSCLGQALYNCTSDVCLVMETIVYKPTVIMQCLFSWRFEPMTFDPKASILSAIPLNHTVLSELSSLVFWTFLKDSFLFCFHVYHFIFAIIWVLPSFYLC